MVGEVTPIRYTFSKSEKLCSRKIIAGLHESGFFVSKFPLRINYAYTDLPVSSVQVQVMVTVSKRKFKRAVDRNRIKRILREVYRYRKHPLITLLEQHQQQLAIGIIYTGNHLPEFWDVDSVFEKVFRKLLLAVDEHLSIGPETPPTNIQENPST